MYDGYDPKGKEIQVWPAVVTVLGGDARQSAAACRLAESVCTVRMFATGEDSVPSDVRLPVCSCRSLWEAWAGSRVMVLPLPVTRDGVTLWCPLAPDREITLADLTEAVAHTARTLGGAPQVFGGKIPSVWREALEAAGGCVFDYFDREDVQVRNAQITAEGAVMTAMELTDITLRGARVAVLGYGRIGRLLAGMLTALGVSVTVFARRTESRAWAMADGCRAADVADMEELTDGYAVVFNTAPAPLLTQKLLENMGKKTLIIDLASPPGGIPTEAEGVVAARGWPRIVHALSLPGRYAPVTAGQVIADGIWDVLATPSEEKGVGV